MSAYAPRNPDYAAAVAALFAAAPFVGELGITLLGCGPGWCEAELRVAPRFGQQHGDVHAGVSVTLADHTAGAAAQTLAPADRTVVTASFSAHLLRAARGERLRCRATVLRPGQALTVVEAELWGVQGEERTLALKATFSLALVARPLA